MRAPCSWMTRVAGVGGGASVRASIINISPLSTFQKSCANFAQCSQVTGENLCPTVA